MTVILIFGAAAGIILGLGRFKVLALLPVILIVGASAIANGVRACVRLFRPCLAACTKRSTP